MPRGLLTFLHPGPHEAPRACLSIVSKEGVRVSFDIQKHCDIMVFFMEMIQRSFNVPFTNVAMRSLRTRYKISIDQNAVQAWLMRRAWEKVSDNFRRH